jgi:hypothetical protein
MWYANEEELVRAPTPVAFDRLVQHLEDNDSVLFQSVSLPNAPPSIRSVSSIRSSLGDLDGTLSDDFEPITETEEIDILKRQIKAALERSAQKDAMIQERDVRISELQKQIARLEGTTEQEDPELLAYYKEQYEATAYQYEKLKEALSAGDPASARRRK